MKIYKIFFLLLSLFLASCSTFNAEQQSVSQPSSKKISWAERQTALNKIQKWHLNGKIAIQTEKEAGSATVDWYQRNESYQFNLMGPLGTNALKLAGYPGKVTLQTADGKTITETSPEGLLAQQGYRIPVSHLRYWIRGLPVPSIPANSEFDTSGRLLTLTQQDYLVQFVSYTQQNSIDLPNKIFITSPKLKTKIIIYQWNIV